MAAQRWVTVALMATVVAAAGGMFAVGKLQRQPSSPVASPSASPVNTFETLESLEAKVKADPHNPALQLALANALFDHKHYDGAIKAYQAVLQHKPDYVPARVDMATAYFYSGHKVEAVQAYQHALKLDPKHVQGLFNLGLVYHSQGRLADARMAWTQAKGVATDPSVRQQIDEKLKLVAWTAVPK